MHPLPTDLTLLGIVPEPGLSVALHRRHPHAPALPAAHHRQVPGTVVLEDGAPAHLALPAEPGLQFNGADQVADLSKPELHLDGEKWSLYAMAVAVRVAETAGMGDERDEGVDHQLPSVGVQAREPLLPQGQLLDELTDRPHSATQRTKELVQEVVAGQAFPDLYRREVPAARSQPQLPLPSQPRASVLVHRIEVWEVAARGVLLVVPSGPKCLFDPEPVLGDHAIRQEGLIEDLRREAGQSLFALLVVRPDGGRGADTAQSPGGCVQARLEAPDEAGYVAALGSVVGVQLIQHQEAQRVRRVLWCTRISKY